MTGYTGLSRRPLSRKRRTLHCDDTAQGAVVAPSEPFRWPFSWPIVTTMNNRALAVGAAVLAVVFVVLNFTVVDAGTLFLILAVAAAVASAYFFTRSRAT